MKRRHTFCIFTALLLNAAASQAAPPSPLYCDRAEYAPFKLSWSQSPGAKLATNIFPHPLLPQRAVLACDTGLLMTDDAGLTWNALPQAAASAVGVIQSVAFHPLEADTFYIASKTKGVWITTDAGKSFRQIGTTANGMAADIVADLLIYPADATCQTLLAVHGDDTGGVSRSRNGGKNWEVLNPGVCFRRILAREKGSTKIYLFGRTKSEPDIQNLYVCSTPSELPMELLRDTMLTDMAFISDDRLTPLYAATSDSGLYRVISAENFNPIGPKTANWASISTVWGPNADVLGLCLYDPSQLGMVFSKDELATMRKYSGPLVSSFVKDGACLRPNANSTVFYCVANGSLSIGRSPESTPLVTITPAVFTPAPEEEKSFDDLSVALRDFSKLSAAGSAAKGARELHADFGDPGALYRHTQITIAARLPRVPAPPVSVTADLSRFGGSEATPLYDDGLHNDGAAGDGVYGLTFSFRPTLYRPRTGDWRRTWPGQVGFGITAIYADGHREGAVALVGIYPNIQSFDLGVSPKGVNKPEGDAQTEVVQNPPEIHKGSNVLCIRTGKGPWSVPLYFPFGKNDITSYQGFSFFIKATEGEPPKELYVQLCDEPELTAPVTTERIAVISEGVREGNISSGYRCVIVPFSRLLGDASALDTSKVRAILISGDGGAPATLWIDRPRILANTEEAIPFNDAPSK